MGVGGGALYLEKVQIVITEVGQGPFLAVNPNFKCVI